MTDERYKPNDNVVYRQEENEAFLFNADTTELITINETGCSVWSLCDGTHTIDAMAARIADEFDVDADTARNDVCEYVKKLVDKNFIVPVTD